MAHWQCSSLSKLLKQFSVIPHFLLPTFLVSYAAFSFRYIRHHSNHHFLQLRYPIFSWPTSLPILNTTRFQRVSFKDQVSQEGSWRQSCDLSKKNQLTSQQYITQRDCTVLLQNVFIRHTTYHRVTYAVDFPQAVNMETVQFLFLELCQPSTLQAIHQFAKYALLINSSFQSKKI